MSDAKVETKRLTYIDVAKGIGILLVVIAHHLKVSNHAVINWIFSFHVPLFFIITGYLYSHNHNKDDAINIKYSIIKNLKRLMWPYLTFSIIAICWYVLFYKVLRFGGAEDSLFIVSIKSLTTFGWFALWFLPVMFFVSVLFPIILKLKKSYLYFSLCIILGMGMGIIIHYFKLYEAFHKSLILYYLLIYIFRIILAIGFAGLGYYCKKIIDSRKNAAITLSSGIISVGSIFIYKLLFNSTGNFNLSCLTIRNPLIDIIAATSGSIFIISISKIIDKYDRVFKYLEKNSLIIMATHMFFPVEIAWIVVGVSRLGNWLNPTFCSIIVIIIEMIIEIGLIELINRKLKFIIKCPFGKKEHYITKHN